MPPEGQAQFQATLHSIFQAAKSAQHPMYPPQVLKRLCLAFAASAVYTPEGCNAYIQEALNTAQAVGGQVAVSVALEMLTVLPEEREGAGISSNRKDELGKQLRAAMPHVLQLLEQMIVAFTETAQRVTILGCLSNWVKLGASTTSLYTERNATYTVVLQSLACADEALCKPAAEVVIESLQVREYPRPDGRNGAIAALSAGLLAARANFAQVSWRVLSVSLERKS
jgi:hypothetical protein